MLNLFHLSRPQPLLPLEEYPKLTVFALHPGSVKTQLVEEAGFPDDMDTVQLPASTMLYLTSGRIDWLNGKSVQYFLGHARSLQSDELRHTPDIWRPTGILQRLREIGRRRYK